MTCLDGAEFGLNTRIVFNPSQIERKHFLTSFKTLSSVDLLLDQRFPSMWQSTVFPPAAKEIEDVYLEELNAREKDPGTSELVE